MTTDESIPTFIDKGRFEVFLSYSSDSEKQFERYVDELKTHLGQHKINVVTAPHDQVGGDDGNDYIISKIQTCDVLLALHTRTCRSSDYFDQEIGIALAYKVPIVPICVKVKPYGFIHMKKCISCENSIIDKASQIIYAIKKQYWNQMKNQSNILFRLNMIKTDIQAIKLLFLLAGKHVQEDAINQLATIYLSDKFLQKKTTAFIIEVLLTKNRANLSDKLRSALQNLTNENLRV